MNYQSKFILNYFFRFSYLGQKYIVFIRDVPIVLSIGIDSIGLSTVSAFLGGIDIGKSEAIFADTTDTCSDENYC